VFGRLHFITRLFGPLAWLRFWSGYLFEDIIRSFLALLRGQPPTARAYVRGWKSYLASLPQTLADRRMIQPRRLLNDRQLLSQQKEIPPVMVWHGLPLLTWEIIQGIYAPLILAGQVKQNVVLTKNGSEIQARPNFLKRMRMVYQIEGSRALLDRLGRIIQHRLRRP
jgi:hypothetical protein